MSHFGSQVESRELIDQLVNVHFFSPDVEIVQLPCHTGIA